MGYTGHGAIQIANSEITTETNKSLTSMNVEQDE